jgi:hypothetical protein
MAGVIPADLEGSIGWAAIVRGGSRGGGWVEDKDGLGHGVCS